jgi:hypothetical protein
MALMMQMALRAHAWENHALLQCDVYDLFSMPPDELSGSHARVAPCLEPQLAAWVRA